MYNIIKQFMIGDLIWCVPAVFSGIISFLFTISIDKKIIRTSIFLILFIALTFIIHLWLDPLITEFQKWYLTPLGPSMNLIIR